MPSKKLFVFGLGYSAARAAREFHREGFAIAGTVRSSESAAQLEREAPSLFCSTPGAANRNVFVFDGSHWDVEANDATLAEILAGTTHILASVPTGRDGEQPDPVLAHFRDELVALKPHLQWVAYLSTIGVYGETHGQVVDETAPVSSTVHRSQLRIRAEQLWLELPGLPIHVFRIAGIYGPGRGTIAKVRSGSATRIHLPGRMFNRIHVDDIANILLASAARPNAGAIYNVCDDEPAPAEDVTAFACELLGVPVMPSQSWEEAEANMSAMAKTFYAESKVCSNGRVKTELGVQLRYPTYREGLLAQVIEEDGQVMTDGTGGGDAVAQLGSDVERLVVLVNIGSLRAEPYLDVRQISFRLSRALRQPVVPCSFRFSHRIDVSELNGLPAKSLEMVLLEHLRARAEDKQHQSRPSEVVVLPLFFGKSATLTEFLPEVLRKSWQQIAESTAPVPLTLRLGRCVVDKDIPEDNRIAQILHDRICPLLNDIPTTLAREQVTVIVLDHGTPSFEVHEAREVVASQLRLILKDSVKSVETACMERRDGAEYDFNDPLLSEALDHYKVSSGTVIVAKLFFSNGRHAGEKGDVEEIADGIKMRHPDVDIRVSEPLGSHHLLTEILQDRFRRALQQAEPNYALGSLGADS